MSPRGRAIALFAASGVCALLAVGIAQRLESTQASPLGPFRAVVITTREVPAGTQLGRDTLAASTVVRRVPVRFSPPDALPRIQLAAGLMVANAVPAGSYLLRSHLSRIGDPQVQGGPSTGQRQPVEIAVTGAGALLVGDRPPEGSRVDVISAREASFGRSARAGVVARSASLLALRRPQSAGDSWRATLSVKRDEALALIAADTSGRQLRLLPVEGRQR